jgi:hypothetical protein
VPRTRPKKGCLKDVDTGEIPVLCDISESTVREPFIDLRRARIALRQHWPLARMRARPPTFLSDGKMGLSTEVRLPARVKWRSTNGSMRSRRVAMYLRTASWTIAQASSCCARSVIFKNWRPPSGMPAPFTLDCKGEPPAQYPASSRGHNVVDTVQTARQSQGPLFRTTGRGTGSAARGSRSMPA